jgi:hypothetical protein
MPGQDDSLLGRIERFGPTLTRDLPIPRGLVGGTPPDQPISLRDLRLRLLAPGTPGEVRDQVWAWLVSKVRADRGEWHTAALLLAMPALRRQARVLAMHRSNARDGDGPVQANLAVEFVFALHRVDPDRPHVAARVSTPPPTPPAADGPPPPGGSASTTPRPPKQTATPSTSPRPAAAPNRCYAGS